MDFSIPSLAAGFVFGVFGAWLLKRAKAEAHLPYLFYGLVLMIYPYFVENPWALWGIGIGLLALAYRS